MNERFKLVLVKLVCVDVDAPNFTKYDFGKKYLAIKDSEDEEQPYGIIKKGCCDMGKILIEIAKSNEIGKPTIDLCCWQGDGYIDWEFYWDYKFKEIHNQK